MSDEIRYGEPAWGANPHPAGKEFIPLLRPRPGRPIRVLILSERPLGVETHWTGGEGLPCFDGPLFCPLCRTGIPTRWKGYIAGLSLPRGLRVIAEITFDSYRQCPELRDENFNLRGKRLNLERMGDAENSRVRAEVLVHRGPEILPEPFDLRVAMERIWFGPGLRRKENYKLTSFREAERRDG